MRFITLTGILVFILCIGMGSGPPETRSLVVKDQYHGVEVLDAYRWLENGNDPQVQGWSDLQNAYTRTRLDKLPFVEELCKRITGIESAASVSYTSLAWRPGKLFARKNQPPLEQPLLVVMPSADEQDAERILLDPNQLDPGGTTSIDWYVPSPDGQLVAVSLSRRGSESGDVHVFETSSGKATGDVIARVNGGTAGGDLAWLLDGSGFYYTRYPRAGERPAEDLDFYQQVWFHTMGDSIQNDRYVIGREFPRIAEIILEMDRQSGRLLVTVQNGDSNRFAHYLVEPDGASQQITTYQDQVVQATFGPNNHLFLISRRDAPRGEILRLSLEDPKLGKAKRIIAEADDTVVSDFTMPSVMVVTPTRLYLTYQLGGPSEIRVFDHDGNRQPGPAILPVSGTGQMVALDKDKILYANHSFIDAPAWYRFDPSDPNRTKAFLATQSPVDFSDTEVVREYAISKDGTRIPVNIIRRKGILLDGSNPVLLSGYGGYGVSLTPGFSAVNRVWIEQGGVRAIANLRGGGEFGEQWHQAGMLTNKQNVFDDFAGAMHHMIGRGYTTPKKLAIVGGSNGGLLMGAMMTQHPDLFQAVVSFVGIYDMLRFERSPNGAFNIPEFGSVTDPVQFKALYAYSPYHHVHDGTAYPATLFLTGANDPRVDPMHSRKMAARLQAATSGDAPILLRTSASTGHGGGTPLSERIKINVDMYAFLLNELKIPYKPQGTQDGF
ncbi:MAG: S9 family peptidase [Pirellulales bacterium]|nr:S9 family peptidase [Pirellulales bacterium]